MESNSIMENILFYDMEIPKIKTTDEMKKMVNRIFKDEEIDDITFTEIIYDSVIPRLKELGVNMEYNEELNETNYEKVLKENY